MLCFSMSHRLFTKGDAERDRDKKAERGRTGRTSLPIPSAGIIPSLRADRLRMLAIVGDVVLAVEIKKIDGDKDKKIDVNRVPCFGLFSAVFVIFGRDATAVAEVGEVQLFIYLYGVIYLLVSYLLLF